MRSDRKRAWARGVAVLLAAGCATPPAGTPVIARVELLGDELGFWQALETSPRVSNDDALHALFLLADGKADYASFTARLVAARERGWVAEDATVEAEGAATVGLVAVAICQVVPLERGVTGQLFPQAPRWCTRDLVFHGFMPERTASQPLHGLELLELVGRVEDWRAVHAGGAGS
ncbi:MAG: hypothetical protein EXS13_06235 [Planctomycetes bacterium]|nr:hypothetical protein [Planctomycetota bacterium]